MVTLYKRATLLQQRLIKIVEGQIISYYKQHELPIDEIAMHSITKRIVGDISAQWDQLNLLRVNGTMRSNVE